MASLGANAVFSTLHPPNSSVPDRLDVCRDHPQALGEPGFENTVASLRSYHPGGVNAVWADGAVRLISDHVDAEVYQAMGTRDGGEVIDSSQLN